MLRIHLLRSSYLELVKGDVKFQFVAGLVNYALLLTLRICVKPSFAFLAMRHVIQWAKIFCLTQRRNDAS